MAPNPTAHELYEGAAHFYERIAADFDADEKDGSALTTFWARSLLELDAPYRLSHLRANPSRPCGRKMMMAMKTMPSGIR